MVSLLSRLLQLPCPLLVLVFNAVASLAQNQQLQINQQISLSSNQLPNPPQFSLPSSSTPLTVSIALCSVPPANSPRFFVSNNSAITNPGPDLGEDVFEIMVAANGIGNVTLDSVRNGGTFAVNNIGSSQTFQVGLSDSGPLHSYLSTLPLFGDSTANQAIVFSPTFLPMISNDPTFPNYTLPLANTSLPELPPASQTPNFTLILGPNSSFPHFNYESNTTDNNLPVTACALQSSIDGLVVGQAGDPSANVQSSQWLKGQDGWRTQFLVNGLAPSTNYMAFVVQDGTKVAGPIQLVTKSASFSCPLVHSLPFCPDVSYTVPLPVPQGGVSSSYDASNFPANVSEPLISYLNNFTTTLLTFPCGRDWYSPLQSCANCQRAYRKWLCAVSLPRCAESRSINAQLSDTDRAAQEIFPALQPQSGGFATRNPFLPDAPSDWTELLPCIETCNAADRSCPDFLGFRCPIPRFNAAQSYGVGYIDGDGSDGMGYWIPEGGRVGKSQDRYGNVWCNG